MGEAARMKQFLHDQGIELRLTACQLFATFFMWTLWYGATSTVATHAVRIGHSWMAYVTPMLFGYLVTALTFYVWHSVDPLRLTWAEEFDCWRRA